MAIRGLAFSTTVQRIAGHRARSKSCQNCRRLDRGHESRSARQVWEEEEPASSHHGRTDGKENMGGHAGHFVESPFRFCLHCRVAYDFRTTSDFGKLTSLGTEGRSTATTISSLATIRHLRKEPTLDPACAQLLSFTDNAGRPLCRLATQRFCLKSVSSARLC